MSPRVTSRQWLETLALVVAAEDAGALPTGTIFELCRRLGGIPSVRELRWILWDVLYALLTKTPGGELWERALALSEALPRAEGEALCYCGERWALHDPPSRLRYHSETARRLGDLQASRAAAGDGSTGGTDDRA